jgi:hypothetical protein
MNARAVVRVASAQKKLISVRRRSRSTSATKINIAPTLTTTALTARAMVATKGPPASSEGVGAGDRSILQ